MSISVSQREEYAMLRKFASAVVVLLLVAGVTVSADKKAGKRGGRGNAVFGKIVSLDLKDGAGTLTVMARKGRGQQPQEMKIQITKDTKFMVGGGRGKPGTPVAADKVAETFKKDGRVVVRVEKKGDNVIATTVRSVTFRKRGGK
jgi:hypothetical protein